MKMISDIIEANGKTIKENNLELTHKIPIDALVEINASENFAWNKCRLYVKDHARDCDGTPLYNLGPKGECHLFEIHTGFNEDSLTEIK